jgi:hypothetical protein
MATRGFMDKQYTLVKKQTTLYAAVAVSGTTPALQKWNYPTLGAGPNARTYTAAPAPSALGTGYPYPNQYAAGAEGVRNVARTAAGLWTVTLQDNYQRVLSVTLNVQVAGGLANIVAVGRNTSVDSMAAQGGSQFGLALLSATGVAADPTSGHVLLLGIVLADGTEP